jgi:hypothetical protein
MIILVKLNSIFKYMFYEKKIMTMFNTKIKNIKKNNSLFNI